MTVAHPDLSTALERLNAPTIGVPDYAVLIETSRPVVYRAIEAGDIPVVRLGQRYRIPSAWVRSQLHMSEPGSAA